MVSTVSAPRASTHGDRAAAQSSSRPLLLVRDLSKGFATSGGVIQVLQKAQFELHAKETVAVVGASGIGKSTLLHILGTLDRPDSGTVAYRGQDVFKLNDAQLASFRNEAIGFVFQFHHLLPEFSALENAMLPLLIQGSGRSEAVRAARELLCRVGLEERLDHRAVQLSGGEQQRVALARALVLKPMVLLADEPTGNLDKSNSQQIHDLLLELNREFDMMMIVVTHNAELAALMSRRVTIAEGKLVEQD